MSQLLPQKTAVFLKGSVLRHVLVMTATGSIGLVSVFIVDLFSLIYISWLGIPALTAGVGFAAQLSFFFISIQVGLSIGVGALVSRSIGAGQRAEARRMAGSALLHIVWITVAVSVLSLPFVRPLLALIGARGDVQDAAALFLYITIPSNVLLALGMALSGVLRAAGDARRSMYVLLSGAIVTAALDPLLILYFRLDVAGAAIATFVARACYAGIGLWAVITVHDLLGRPVAHRFWGDLKMLLRIAFPAILANLAAPVSTTYALYVLAQFGEGIVAAWAMIDRIVGVAYGPTFALSGSVGPVIGQNFGGRRFDRVRATLTACYQSAIVYGAIVWAILALAAPAIAGFFGARGETAELTIFFCRWGAGAWMFLGCLFAANAAFNNLGYPMLSMAFNWGRATLGTIPFVTLGAAWGGPKGAIFGMGVGAAVFGVIAIATSYAIARRLASGQNRAT